MRPTTEQQEAWMAQWRRAAVALARIRAAEIQSADPRQVALDLEQASLAAAPERVLSVHSGLIDQQRIFRHRHPA